MQGLWKARSGELIEALIRITPLAVIYEYPRIQFEVLEGPSLEELENICGDVAMVSVMPKREYYFYLPSYGLAKGSVNTTTIVPRPI